MAAKDEIDSPDKVQNSFHDDLLSTLRGKVGYDGWNYETVIKSDKKIGIEINLLKNSSSIFNLQNFWGVIYPTGRLLAIPMVSCTVDTDLKKSFLEFL